MPFLELCWEAVLPEEEEETPGVDGVTSGVDVETSGFETVSGVVVSSGLEED
jgi:hypothetical protein